MKIYSEEQIESLGIENKQIMHWVKEAFLCKQQSFLPHKISQTFNNGNNFYNTMPAIMPTIDSAGVKIVSRYPERTPSIKGDLLLYRYSDGQALALMDATWITKKRTGAVAALAVETFAQPDFESIAVLGLGQAGRSFLEMFITNENNKNKTFKLMSYKNHAEEASIFLRRHGVKNIKICYNYKELIQDSDVIVSALTVANNQIGEDEWFKKGVLVVPIHTRGFQNCDLFFNKIFADDEAHVEDFKYFSQFKTFGEIDKVLLGEMKGRESDDERILSYNIGIALHDIYLAKKIYNLSHR
ncbi:MAG TPA: hypothetical protein VFD78_02235 [Chitinophagaceae bacterium]|nr:hypothetical protein [Chitinophagaceae bacterium]